MNYEKTIAIDEGSLIQWMISDVRYSFPRDNSAVFGCRTAIQRYLPKLSDEWREYAAGKLTEEVIDGLEGVFASPYGHKAVYDRKDCQVLNEDGTITLETLPVTTWVSDYAYKEYMKDPKGYKPSEYGLDMSKLAVDPEFSWEEENEWLLLIAVLSDYIEEGYKPYQSSYAKWETEAKKTAQTEKDRAEFMTEWRKAKSK